MTTLRCLLIFALNFILVADVFGQCSTEDTIVLAKQGYKKSDIEEMCQASKSITKQSEKGSLKYKSIADKLKRVFTAQFSLVETNSYSSTTINKSTSAKVEQKKLYFEMQGQSSAVVDDGQRINNSFTVSSSALLSDLDPNKISVRGEKLSGSYYYTISIGCKGESRCALLSGNSGTERQNELVGDYMPSRQSELVDMIGDIKYLITH